MLLQPVGYVLEGSLEVVHDCLQSSGLRHSSPITNSIALSTNPGSTQRGGLRWIETWPPKSPNTFRIAGESTLSGLPALSFPSLLIWYAVRNNRLPGPPLTSTRSSFCRSKTDG